MFPHKILLTISALFALLFYSCSDNPASLGSNILPDVVNVKVIDSTTDSIPQTSSFYKKPVDPGSAVTLLLGKSENVESSILIKFLILLPDSIKADLLANSITVQSAAVELYKKYSFGNEAAPFDFTAHKINSSWQSSTFTADSLPILNFEAADVSSNKVFTDSINKFNLDNQLVFSWLQAEADTSQPDPNGIYLKPDASSQKIAGFQALVIDNSQIPRIKIIIEKAGSYIDTLDFISNSDVSAATGEVPNVSFDNIVVQAGLAVNSKLFFDLSNIPENAVIGNAELILTIDSTATKTGSNFTNSLIAYFVVDSTLDSLSGSIRLDKMGNNFRGDITSFIKRWIDTGLNQGILLTAFDQLNGVEIFALKGSNAAEAVKPRLEIIYTTIQ